MKLRHQLLILSLLVLALPLAAWQFVGKVDDLLRQAMTRAQQQTLKAVADNLLQRQTVVDELILQRQGLYLQPVSTSSLRIDGYGDDWRNLLSVETLKQRQFTTHLARDSYYVYGLMLIPDNSLMNSLPGQEGGDGVVLNFTNDQGLWRIPIFWEGLGQTSKRVKISDKQDNTPLDYAVQYDADAYVLEWRLPVSAVGNKLQILVFNNGSKQVQPDQDKPKSLISYDRSLEFRLQAFINPGDRLWLANPAGWVLAQAGNERIDTEMVQAENNWLQAWMYRLLSGHVELDGFIQDHAWRFSGQFFETAIENEGNLQWWLDTDSSQVSMLAALPIRSKDHQIIGILISEQRNHQILFLADQALRELLWVSGLVFLVAVLLLLAFASILSARVRRLQKAVDSAWHDQQGFKSDFTPSSKQDELGELSRSYAQMLLSLSEHTTYLQGLADKLSHEIKTPLAVVRTSLENLEQEEHISHSPYLKRARKGLFSLQRILQAMSEANRLEQSIKNEGKIRFCLNTFLQDYLDMARQGLKNQNLVILIPDEQIDIAGSPELMAQLLDKLLDNADSFCSPTGAIQISLKMTEKQAFLSVENDGPLIPENIRLNLFDSMVSVRAHQTKKDVVHLGLGLHIVQLITRFHQADMSARNRDDGSGVIFEMSFSRAQSV